MIVFAIDRVRELRMSFRFRQAVRLFPGVRLNISKSGLSVSVGGPGATLNFGARGSALTLGLPGTGLSYRTQLTPRKQPKPSAAGVQPTRPSFGTTHPDASEPENPDSSHLPSDGEIRSADIAQLTTPDLAGLKNMLNEAAAKKKELEIDLVTALRERNRTWRRLRRAEQLPLRPLLRLRLPRLRAAFADADAEAQHVAGALAACRVKIDFNFDARTLDAFRALGATHCELSKSAKFWDVTASLATDRYAQRTIASSTIRRTPVRLGRSSASVVAGAWSGLQFENANGEDIELFPGLCLLRSRASADYALIDMRELQIDFTSRQFVEDEIVPHDSRVVGHTWSKTNRDGSPDRRFKGNYQIPIVLYGELSFASGTGISEIFQSSNVEAAAKFTDAYHEMQAALGALARTPDGVMGDTDAASPLQRQPIDERPALPALPKVRPAHEYTATFLLLAFTPVAAAWLLTRSPPPVAVPLIGSPDLSIERQRETAAQSFRTEPPPPPSIVAPDDTSPPVTRERLIVRQASNVRAEPSQAAAVLRVAPKGAVLLVFGRSGVWIQVGEAEAWGWVHSSLLHPTL